MPMPIGLRDPPVPASGRLERLVDDLLQRRLGVEAAVADRVVHAGQPGVELRAEERGHVVVAVLGEQLRRRAAPRLGDRAHTGIVRIGGMVRQHR